MNLDAALSIAAGGLANINRQFDVVSQNIANANTPGYAREVAAQQSATTNGIGMGVRTLPTGRETNDLLQAGLLSQSANVADLATRQTTLQAIDQVQGTPGQGNDLASLSGKLQDSFSALSGSPDSQSAQQKVAIAAQTIANSINVLAGAYGRQRQSAQDTVVRDVAAVNAALGTIGNLSDKIVGLKATGQSTADLENQRDAAIASISQLVGLKTLAQANGDLLVMSTSGLSLPIHGSANPFAIANATLGASTYYPAGGTPGLTLNGIDVTQQISGGRIGASIALRDVTLPTYQAELDEFAQNLASRFDAQGLRLFTDPTGVVPGAGVPVQSSYLGFANIIQVNPLVSANPALLRDGTQAVAGSPTGASAFTPNPAGGPAGFGTMISRVLDYTFGPEVQNGVPQAPSNTTGLGPAGNLAAPYPSGATLTKIATSLVASQAQASNAVAVQLGTEQAVQNSIAAKLSSETGVNIDTEMSSMIELQNAYSANAKIISAAQTMWSQLLQSIQ